MKKKKSKTGIYLIVLNQKNNEKKYFKLKKDFSPFDEKSYLLSFGFNYDADIKISSQEHTNNPNLKIKHALKSESINFLSYKCIARKKKGKYILFQAIVDEKEEVKLNNFDTTTENIPFKYWLYKVRIAKKKGMALISPKKFSFLQCITFILTGLITIVSIFLSVYTNENYKDWNSLALLASILGGFKFLNYIFKKIILTIDFTSYRKSIFFEDVSDFEKDQIILTCTHNLSKAYESFKNVVYESDSSINNKDKQEKEAFIYSKAENENLKDKAKTIIVKKESRKNYGLDDSIRALASIVNDKLNQDKLIFNGKLLGIATDLNFGELSEFKIKKVRYYDYISCDELIYKNIYSKKEPGYFFEGKNMCIYPKTNKLKDIQNSILTNLIGVNLIVKLLTSEQVYYIINEQSPYNDVNRKKLVPSASGSAEKNDFKKGINLEELLKKAMLRELKEESLLDGNIIERAEFKLLGFSRLVSKGGKPDFFGMLEIKDIENISEILKIYNHQQIKKIGKDVIKSPLESGEMLLISEKDFLYTTGWENHASPQLRYIKGLLNDTL